MQMTIEKSVLFTEISADESAEINGACHYYYYRPTCWSPCQWGGHSYGGGSGGGYNYGYGSAVNQTTNVNVLIND